LCLTCSSKRTCRVAVFGCFDGDFSIAKCFFSFRYSRSITFRITTCILGVLRAANTGSRCLRDSSHSPVSRPQIFETCVHRKVKKPLKTKLKKVVLNPLHALRPDSRCARRHNALHIDACSICWAGATPAVFSPRASGEKWGRSSPLRCFVRVQNQRPRETQPQCSVRLPFTEKVNGTVNRSVNRVFHAPFTFPRQKRPPNLSPALA
jgi:hypothetical protein